MMEVVIQWRRFADAFVDCGFGSVQFGGKPFSHWRDQIHRDGLSYMQVQFFAANLSGAAAQIVRETFGICDLAMNIQIDVLEGLTSLNHESISATKTVGS